MNLNMQEDPFIMNGHPLPAADHDLVHGLDCRVLPGQTARLALEVATNFVRRVGYRALCLELVDATLEFGAEMTDQPLDRPCRGITECANSVALNLTGEFLQ